MGVAAGGLGGNPIADQKVNDGYPIVDTALDAATGACCTFRAGQRCNAAGATGTGAAAVGFDGLLDEVTLYAKP